MKRLLFILEAKIEGGKGVTRTELKRVDVQHRTVLSQAVGMLLFNKHVFVDSSSYSFLLLSFFSFGSRALSKLGSN